MKKKKNIFLTVLKIILIIILVIVFILVSGYFFLKYYLHFDIIQLKNTLSLINKEYSTTEVINNSFNNDITFQAFNKIYNTNSVYTLNNGVYTFDKSTFETTSIQNNAILTDKEIGGLLNVYINNYQDNLDLDDDFLNEIELKQINFKNLDETEENYILNVNITYKINLFDFSEEDSSLSFLNQFIPKNIYITSFLSINFQKTNLEQYFFTNEKIIINNLTEEETKYILNFFNSVGLNNMSDELKTEIGDFFCSTLFGKDSTPGFIKSIKDNNGFDFDTNNNAICIKIKKV